MFRQVTASAVALMVVALVGCGSSGGGGGGGGGDTSQSATFARNDVYVDQMRNMTGMGGVMVHFDVVWESVNATPIQGVTVELQREDGSVVPGTRRTIPRIASGGRVATHISAEGFADNTRLFVVLDPEAGIEDSNRDNNRTAITAMTAPMPSLSDDVDVQFIDCHYHQMYYFNNPEFHFYVTNPERWGIPRASVPYVIYDDGVEMFRGNLGQHLVNFREHDDDGDVSSYLQIYLPVDVVTATRRPEKGRRHVFTIHIDPAGTIAEKNKANNWMRFVADVPNDTVLKPSEAKPDIRLQDPHFHQYPGERRAVFHFFSSNITTTNAAQQVQWKIVRDDGVLMVPTPERIATGRASNPLSTAARGFGEASFTITDDTNAEVGYTLILDPDNLIEETDETNNQIRMIIDWSPNGFG